MMKKTVVLMGVILALVLVAFPAQAQDSKDDYPSLYIARPQTLAKGMGEVQLDLGLGLSSGRVAKDMLVDLRFGYGLLPNLELGVDINALNYADGAQGAAFGGAAIYTTWEFWKFLALYGDVHFPGGGLDYLDSFGDQLVGLRVGVQAKYVIVEHLLNTYGGVFIDVGFASDTVAVETPQMNVILEYGLAINAMQYLWFDLNVQADMGLRPSAGSFTDRMDLPLKLTIGSTPLEQLDVWLAFEAQNLTPQTGGAFDSRMVWLGAAFRF